VILATLICGLALAGGDAHLAVVGLPGSAAVSGDLVNSNPAPIAASAIPVTGRFREAAGSIEPGPASPPTATDPLRRGGRFDLTNA
jgi:hypothetical protein